MNFFLVIMPRQEYEQVTEPPSHHLETVFTLANESEDVSHLFHCHPSRYLFSVYELHGFQVSIAQF